MSTPGTLGTREDSAISAFGTLGTGEDAVISACGTLGTQHFKMTRTRESMTESRRLGLGLGLGLGRPLKSTLRYVRSHELLPRKSWKLVFLASA